MEDIRGEPTNRRASRERRRGQPSSLPTFQNRRNLSLEHQFPGDHNAVERFRSGSYGLLALCAENMYAAAPNALNPPAPSQIAAAGWNIVGYLTAQDVLIPSRLAPDQKLRINQSKRVFYGFVAQNVARPTAFVAAIRGTEAPIEWFIDADFLLIPHPRYPGAQVEQGFWGIYQTMSLADLSGVTTSSTRRRGRRAAGRNGFDRGDGT